MIYLEKILTGFLLGWFATQFEPFKLMLNRFNKYGFYKYIYKLVSCIKCSSFWITLAFTQNFVIAIAASFISDLYDKHLNIIKL